MSFFDRDFIRVDSCYSWLFFFGCGYATPSSSVSSVVVFSLVVAMLLQVFRVFRGYITFEKLEGP